MGVRLAIEEEGQPAGHHARVSPSDRARDREGLVEASHAVKDDRFADRRATIRFFPGGNEVVLRGEGEGATWRSLLEAFGVNTDEIASQASGDNPQFQNYDLRLRDAWASRHAAKGFEMSSPGADRVATVTFAPKKAPATTAKASGVSFKYWQGRLSEAVASWPGKHPPKTLMERTGVSGKLVPMPPTEPGRNAWNIVSPALAKQGLTAEVVVEKNRTWLILLPSLEEPTGGGEGGQVVLDLPKLLGKSLAEWEKVLGKPTEVEDLGTTRDGRSVKTRRVYQRPPLRKVILIHDPWLSLTDGKEIRLLPEVAEITIEFTDDWAENMSERQMFERLGIVTPIIFNETSGVTSKESEPFMDAGSVEGVDRGWRVQRGDGPGYPKTFSCILIGR